MSELEDELTGVHNRRSFLSLLRRQILLANNSQSSLALIVLDVCGFGHINRAYGYEFGDALLQHVAKQLREVARAHDYVARLGGDRFALILPRVMNKGHAELAVQKLFRQFDLPFESEQHRVKLTISVGAALCPLHATHADFLLRQAENSLESARGAGQNFQFAADTGQEEGFSEFWDIELDLAGAHERGEMFMHYQPKLRCADRHAVGAEALMRWQSRSRGAVSPGVFIPIAEQTGHIKNLTIWAMNTALRQASEWSHPLEKPSMAVNVPAELVAQHDLPDLVENALKLWGRDDVQLILEITERSLVADPKHSFKMLSRIRDLGVKISIDDFGTGYSCLAYFKNIPCDELKIDRSFVCELLSDPACADLTHLIIDLGHRFGMSVVAEGIEDEPTFEALRALGCDVVQGYLFAKAMRHDDFERWLQPQAQPALAEPAFLTEEFPELTCDDPLPDKPDGPSGLV